jgi:hypothetical protein
MATESNESSKSVGCQANSAPWKSGLAPSGSVKCQAPTLAVLPALHTSILLWKAHGGQEKFNERFEGQGRGSDRGIEGIGAAIAKHLSAAVVVNYALGKEDADRVVADIKANGGKAIAVKGDVAKAADARRLFAETKEAFDRLDVLVNNAGVYKFLPLEEITEDEFHRQFSPPS